MKMEQNQKKMVRHFKYTAEKIALQYPHLKISKKNEISRDFPCNLIYHAVWHLWNAWFFWREGVDRGRGTEDIREELGGETVVWM